MTEITSGERRYFAAANSGNGFCSYYKYIFDSSKLDSLIIVKGGSGTGKSCFIKKLGSEGERRGGRAEYFYCSSDPTSLDGLILETGDGRRIAAVDGTAPHVRDTELPGCCDIIHDTGKYWDSTILSDKREEIKSLIHKRKSKFADIYDHLSAALSCERIADRIVEKNTDFPKLEAAINRLFKKIDLRHGDGRIEYRLTDSIGMRGRVRFDTFTESADKVYRVTGNGWKAFFDTFVKMAKMRGANMFISPYYLDTDKVSGVFLPTESVAFVREDSDIGDKEYGVINTARFSYVYDKADRKEIKRVMRSAKSALTEAESAFGEVRRIHFILEDIYSDTMNFELKDAEEKALIASIL